MRRNQEHEEQREPAEGRDTAKRNIAYASKCQRGSVAGGKRKSGAQPQRAAHNAVTPLDGLKLLLKIRLFQAKGLEVGKVEGESLPRRFPQEARHDVVHTNVDTKKQADLRHICKLSALSVEKTEVSITAPTFYANSYLRALLRRC